jgi:hypothetical protein
MTNVAQPPIPFLKGGKGRKGGGGGEEEEKRRRRGGEEEEKRRRKEKQWKQERVRPETIGIAKNTKRKEYWKGGVKGQERAGCGFFFLVFPFVIIKNVSKKFRHHTMWIRLGRQVVIISRKKKKKIVGGAGVMVHCCLFGTHLFLNLLYGQNSKDFCRHHDVKTM